MAVAKVEGEKGSWWTNPKREEKSLRTIINSRMENSSAHGVPNIQRSSGPSTKLSWILIFLGGTGVMTWQVISLFQAYFEWNYTVNLEVRFNRTQSFPAVTICNTNPMRKSKLEATDESFRERFDVSFHSEPSPQEDFPDGAILAMHPNGTRGESMHPNFSNGTQGESMHPSASNGTRGESMHPSASIDSQGEFSPEPSDVMETVMDWASRIMKPRFYRSKSVEYANRRLGVVTLANRSLEERVFLGHNLHDMLLDCSWTGLPCSPENFTTFYDSQLGNCYTFNSGQNGEQVETHRPGASFGLSLELFAQQEDYVEVMTEVAGFRVIIHHPSTMPFPADDGILVPPGFLTGIGLRVLEVDRLPKPYGDCKADRNNDIEDDIYHQHFNITYNRKTCEVSCYQNEVINRCGCFDASYPNSLNINQTIYPCEYSNPVETQCMANIEHEHARDELECKCPIACHEITYLPRVSSSIWPSDAYESVLFEKMALYNAEMRRHVRGENASDWTRRNMAKLEIFYDEFNYEYIRQDPAYTIPDLLSDIGGQLGLWLGLSVITIFEFVEGAWILLAFLFSRFGNKTIRSEVSPGTKKT